LLTNKIWADSIEFSAKGGTPYKSRDNCEGGS
jgi:hypothetical protein